MELETRGGNLGQPPSSSDLLRYALHQVKCGSKFTYHTAWVHQTMARVMRSCRIRCVTSSLGGFTASISAEAASMLEALCVMLAAVVHMCCWQVLACGNGGCPLDSVACRVATVCVPNWHHLLDIVRC